MWNSLSMVVELIVKLTSVSLLAGLNGSLISVSLVNIDAQMGP